MNRKELYTQWDRQTNNRTAAYIKLNNLYLTIERHEVDVTLAMRLELERHLSTVYPDDDTMYNYWLTEMQNNLPNFCQV